MYRRAGILISLIVVSLWLALPSQAAAQTGKTLTATPVHDVNIRSTPGLSAGVLTVLPSGAQATVIGRTSGNNWLQVEYQGTRGWLAGWLVTCNADTINLDVTTDVQPNPINPATTTKAYAPHNVNIRKEPSQQSEILKLLPFNAQADTIGRTSDSSWVMVDYGGVQGWVARWLVILQNDVNGLPVSGESGSIPSGPQPTSVVPASGTPVPPVSSSPTGIIVTAPYRVNIRTSPSVSANVIDIMAFNSQAAALARNVGNNWIQIKYGDTTGWVAKWVVVASDNTANLPVGSDIAEVGPHLGNTPITGTSIYPVVIRSGPSFNFGQLGTIAAGGSATLLARTADSSWIKVNSSGIEGWAASWVIVSSVDMNVLPVEQP